MRQEQKIADFFLGANSGDGFVSFFDRLQDPRARRLYYVKGTPGSGKSTLMQQFAARHAEESLLERIHCSSDPDSLDGVILNDRGIAIIDATPPHALEPRYPLAAEETVNILSACDPAPAIEERDAILSLSEIISSYHRHFCRLLKNANILFQEARSLLLPQVNWQKLEQQTLRMAKREFQKRSLATGCEEVRMLSAFTPKGLLRFDQTVHTLCDRVYLLHDEYRVAAPVLLELLRYQLNARGAAFYACRSPYDPANELEAILIPSLSLGFVTVHQALPSEDLLPARTIHCTRFLSPEVLSDHRSRLRFYRKTAQGLLEEGIETLQKAKAAHDRLEEYYRPCVDFSKVEALGNALP